MSSNKITVQSTIAADVKKVWEYYTNPAHIIGWNFASDDWQCPWAKNDMKPGGKYSARMEAKDGSFGFEFEAIYDSIVDQKAFAYTMLDGRKADVHFENKGNGTLVTVTFDPEQMNPLEMQRGGWQAILDNFKKYTEAN
ncbi:activator of HSP90 ATPase [Leptospira langatensis]|uniref:Activator of HSP90 ATPase n=1 Tax=Leptospira langatensis TaxID=2484983 RepID=A0A5F1ZSE8_9LEPT|nr:SRPBCC family protein [Leptospira langatensis]TGK01821.1 activator of HSP90 ATPase [Leptospira langatensis]TGL39427.1 activator of HSP90 ATPase [Leptospira langatensis]